MRRNRSAPKGLSRRQAMAAVAAAPLAAALPRPAAARGPRYRRRRATAAAAPERALFAAGPTSLTQVHDFIDRQWARLARHLAKPPEAARSEPFRQGDLLAGLALRYRRPDVLAALIAATAMLPRWQPRRDKWMAGDGAWHRRWTASSMLTWSWHDGGVLTHSALPLKLSA